MYHVSAHLVSFGNASAQVDKEWNCRIALLQLPWFTSARDKDAVQTAFLCSLLPAVQLNLDSFAQELLCILPPKKNPVQIVNISFLNIIYFIVLKFENSSD